MRKIVLFAVLTQVFFFMQGQSAKEQLEIVNSAEISTSEFYEQVSVENKFGYFIVPVQIGAKTYQYIFDTGGYNTLTSQIIRDNDLPELMEVEVGSANQIKSNILMTKIPSLKIGNLEIKDVGALNFDFDESPSIRCYTNGGLIGKSIIKNAVWQINAQEKKIVITDDIHKLTDLDNAIKIKVKLDKLYNPFIKAELNGKTFTFLLDFGFNGLLSLTEKDGQNIRSNHMVQIIGEGATSANGILKESTFIKQVADFSIGKLKLSNKIAYYAKSNNYNLIGADITNYFIVTLNFKDKELLLTPFIHDQEKANYNLSKFGFSLNRNDENIYVSTLYTGGSAEQAGLKLNDIVLSINNQDLNGESYCDFYDYFVGLLHKNNAITLTVKRGKSEEQLRIEKRELFD